MIKALFNTIKFTIINIYISTAAIVNVPPFVVELFEINFRFFNKIFEIEISNSSLSL